MEPCPSAIFQRRAAELPGKNRREFALIFVTHLCRDLGHPQFGVPQQLCRPAHPCLPQECGEIFPEHTPEVVFQAGFAHLEPLGKLPRRVVLAQIGAQDLTGFPGNGHLGAGEVADRRTGLHRLALHFPEQPGGEQLDQTQLLGIPQLPQFIQRRLNGGRGIRKRLVATASRKRGLACRLGCCAPVGSNQHRPNRQVRPGGGYRKTCPPVEKPLPLSAKSW